MQVKSSSAPVDVEVVRELNGVLSSQDADDLLEAVFRNYDEFDKELQAELPLKQMWSLVED